MKEKLFVMPDYKDADMAELTKRAARILDYLKANHKTGDREPEIADAIVLGIFAVFNPSNLPMSEEQVETLFTAYQDYLRRKFTLN
jgi:hypothetical protein